MHNEYSVFTKISSAGAKSKAPPHTIQPLVLLTTSFISDISKSTGMIVSALSAVPAAEVIALEDVFGMFSPEAATIGTTSKVVLSPGTPPILCLSTICLALRKSCFPVITIEDDRLVASSRLRP